MKHSILTVAAIAALSTVVSANPITHVVKVAQRAVVKHERTETIVSKRFTVDKLLYTYHTLTRNSHAVVKCMSKRFDTDRATQDCILDSGATLVKVVKHRLDLVGGK